MGSHHASRCAACLLPGGDPEEVNQAIKAHRLDQAVLGATDQPTLAERRVGA